MAEVPFHHPGVAEEAGDPILEAGVEEEVLILAVEEVAVVLILGVEVGVVLLIRVGVEAGVVHPYQEVAEVGAVFLHLEVEEVGAEFLHLAVVEGVEAEVEHQFQEVEGVEVAEAEHLLPGEVGVAAVEGLQLP